MSATSDPANTPDLDLPFARGVALLRAGRQGADGIARDLVRQLTDAERLGLLDGDQGFWEGVREMGRHGYNHRPIVAGAVPRLGLPGIRFTDGPRGIVMGRSTCFPVAMARGATWDPALEEEIGRAIGAEGRAQGANLFAGVCVNLLRHPAWGRAQETYGEDPVVAGELGNVTYLTVDASGAVFASSFDNVGPFGTGRITRIARNAAARMLSKCR